MGLLGISRTSKENKALIEAAKNGDVISVEKLLSGAGGGKRANAEACNRPTKRTILMEAVLANEGSPEQVIAKLKRYGADFSRVEKVPVRLSGDKDESIKVDALDLAALHGRRQIFLLMIKENYTQPSSAQLARLLPLLQTKLKALTCGTLTGGLLHGNEEEFRTLINDVHTLLPDDATMLKPTSSRSSHFSLSGAKMKMASREPTEASVQRVGGKVVNAVVNLLVTVRADRINKHRMRQQLWGALSALGPEEAYLLLQVCESIDDKDKDFKAAVKAGLASLNVARILAQTITEVEYLWHSYQNFEGQWFKEILGGFGATENTLTLTPFVRNTIIATVLGSGSAVSRWFSGGRETLLTDSKSAVTNLQANGNFEDSAIRVIGAQHGRKVVSHMRQHLRLPTDELVIRAFNATPAATMTNNGQEHVLAVVVRHWTEMLEGGNFSHQRQEQIDPINAIRILMPAVIVYRANFRGLGRWDSRALSELVGACQALEGNNIGTARKLLGKLKDAARGLAGGTPLFFNLFTRWCELISTALDELVRDAAALEALLTPEILATIDTGVTFAAQLAEYASSPDVSDAMLLDLAAAPDTSDITATALLSMPLEDATTYRDLLVSPGGKDSDLYQMLLGRVLQLVRRERMRRKLDSLIAADSQQFVAAAFLKEGATYWVRVSEGEQTRAVYHGLLTEHGGHFFKKHTSAGEVLIFVENLEAEVGVAKVEEGKVYRTLDSGSYLLCTNVDEDNAFFREMIYVAPKEAEKRVTADTGLARRLTAAQELWMRVELDYGPRFRLSSFMELEGLRGPLQRLHVVGQLQCRVLDAAKLDALAASREAALSNPATLKPENLLVAGGGPTGMLLAVHAATGIIATGGMVQLFEKRNAGFERAQVVRLDPRWVHMLRFHCGTGFEDLWVAMPGQSQPFPGSVIAIQGFIECCIKDMENCLFKTVEALSAAGLMTYSPGTGVAYNRATDEFGGEKGKDAGVVVNPAGGIKHVVNSGGKASVYIGNLTDYDQVIGTHGSFRATTDEPYGTCCLEGVKTRMVMHRYGNLRFKKALHNLLIPNTRVIGDFTKAVAVPMIAQEMRRALLDLGPASAAWRTHCLEAVLRGNDGAFNILLRHITKFVDSAGRNVRQRLQCRVFEVGQTYYVGMEFSREYSTMWDELWEELSASKTFAPPPAVQRDLVTALVRLFFHSTLEVLRQGNHLLAAAVGGVPSYATFDQNITTKVKDLDIGDTFLLKTAELTPLLSPDAQRTRSKRERMKNTFRGTKVYYKIKKKQAKLRGAKDVSLVEDDGTELQRCELLEPPTFTKGFLCRDPSGQIFRATGNEDVRKAADSARTADRLRESKLAISTFPVAHYVNHHAVTVRKQGGGVFADMGDAQSSPHFMRYSGLTGAAISAMLFQNFMIGAGKGKAFPARVAEYADMVEWSNNEVVTRGVGAGYGEDGFLRPGFSYSSLVRYLISKATEHRDIHGAPGADSRPAEPNAGLDDFLSAKWKIKFAAGLIPRGLEFDDDYLRALRGTGLAAGRLGGALGATMEEHFAWRRSVVAKHLLGESIPEGEAQEGAGGMTIHEARTALAGSEKAAALEEFLTRESQLMSTVCKMLMTFEETAREEERQGLRTSTLGSIQTRPIDGLIQTEGTAVQSAATGLVTSITFNASVNALTSTLLGMGLGDSLVTVGLSAFSVISATGSLISALRYKAINWQAQLDYYSEKLPLLKRRLFSYLAPERARELAKAGINPSLQWIAEMHGKCLALGDYYGCNLDAESWKLVESAVGGIELESRLGNLSVGALDKLLQAVDFLLVSDAQAQPYVQEELARLKAAAKQLREQAEGRQEAGPGVPEAAGKLLDQVLKWEEGLAGLLKQPLTDDFARWAKSSTFNVTGRAKVTVQTITILSELTKFSDAHRRRGSKSEAGVDVSMELHDLQGMAIAVSETHKANLLIAAAATSITASVATTAVAALNLLAENSAIVGEIGAVSGTLVGIPAIIAIGFTTRQEYFNRRVASSLKGKMKSAALSPSERKTLRKVIRLANANSAVNATRISASLVITAGAILTAVSGPAAGATASIVGGVGAGLGATAIAASLYVRFGQTYRLPTDLPSTIVSVYRSEIQQLYDSFITNDNPSPAEQRSAWGSAADAFLRDRHFEQSIGRDRTAAVRQIIESGMEEVADELEDLGLLLPAEEVREGGKYELPTPVTDPDELQVGQELVYVQPGIGGAAVKARFTSVTGKDKTATFTAVSAGVKLGALKPAALPAQVFDPEELELCLLEKRAGGVLTFVRPNGERRTANLLEHDRVLARRPDEFLTSRLHRVHHLQSGMCYNLPVPVDRPALLNPEEEILYVSGGALARTRFTAVSEGAYAFRNITTNSDFTLTADTIRAGASLFHAHKVEKYRLVGEPDRAALTAEFEHTETKERRIVAFVNERTLLLDAIDEILAARLETVSHLQVGALYRIPARVTDGVVLERGQVVMHIANGVATRCEFVRRLRDDTVHLRPLVSGFDVMLSPKDLASELVVFDTTDTVKARLVSLPTSSAAVAMFDCVESGATLQIPIVGRGELVAERMDEVPEAEMLSVGDLKVGGRYSLPSPISDPGSHLALGQNVLLLRSGVVATCRFISFENGEIMLEDLSNNGSVVLLKESEVAEKNLLFDPDDYVVATLPAKPSNGAKVVEFNVEATGATRTVPVVDGRVVVSELAEGGSRKDEDGDETGSGEDMLSDLMSTMKNVSVEMSVDEEGAPISKQLTKAPSRKKGGEEEVTEVDSILGLLSESMKGVDLGGEMSMEPIAEHEDAAVETAVAAMEQEEEEKDEGGQDMEEEEEEEEAMEEDVKEGAGEEDKAAPPTEAPELTASMKSVYSSIAAELLAAPKLPANAEQRARAPAPSRPTGLGRSVTSL